MRKGQLTAIALVATFAAASSAGAAPQEIGYVPGELAVADLDAGRLDRAELTLAAQNAQDARDPARLINIGIVYARTNRAADARLAFAAAEAAPATSLILSDGRELSSRDIARDQMRRLDRTVVAAR